jgi:hypothetical protein
MEKLGSGVLYAVRATATESNNVRVGKHVFCAFLAEAI